MPEPLDPTTASTAERLAGADDGTDSGVTTPERRRHLRRPTWQETMALVATGVTMIPGLLVIAKFAFRDVLLTGDIAITDARMRDLDNGILPLLGPYSNGWAHPGPMVFYLLAPLHKLSGGASWALVVGGVVLALVAMRPTP